ncbi:hypothetical protein NE237_017902 [Protea cynaroides]|uniref:3-hydroxyisobutyryl-CoA hydrolase n=1 Tax=Protea cynaroides TaxID=273540 RepID=A0A9Q0K8W8_9MAGN|nr:hypothetical protein NE237_017902 [Protea cynaroides]
MATQFQFKNEPNQVLFEENSCVRKVILNRPTKLNSLAFHMVSQMSSKLKEYEKDSRVKLVILKGNGKAFCAGGDCVAVIQFCTLGHWSFGASFYRKQLTLDYIIATYNKNLVCLIDGIVMGGGAGLSMNGKFRVVTEKTVFAMPEADIGLFPDTGEYLGLTGAQLDGCEMIACGLATHFVFSKIREGRRQNLDQCLIREFGVNSHVLRRTVNNDFYEGCRAKFFDKDKRPKWYPSKLELVSNEMVNQYFRKVDDDDWEDLRLDARSVVAKFNGARL